MNARGRLVILHRWLGLTAALFLVLTGLTGAILAWEHELDAWLAPHLHHAKAPQPGMAMMEGLALRQRVAEQLGPQAQVLSVELHGRPGQAVRLAVRPVPNAPALAYDEVYANPYTGEVQGSRYASGLHWGPEYVLSFLFQLHCSLALPDPWGTVILGIVALLWTIDCIIGAWITLPLGRRLGSRAWWRHWQTAWSIKRPAAFYRRNLDLHRASGLWLWAMLFVLAWSSVMFNLRPVVWQPVMGLVFDFDESWYRVPASPPSSSQPKLDWAEGLAASRRAMAQLASQQGFTTDTEQQLSYNPGQHSYVYMVHSTADLRSEVGNTAVKIDADTGELLGHWLPTGGATGNTVSNWLGALHMGHVFGWPYRVFLSVVGAAVVMLSVTGVVVWWKKRQARLHLRARRPGALANPGPRG